MAGTFRVMIPRHFRTKRSRVNGVSDAFRPPEEARTGARGTREKIAVTAKVLGANVDSDV